MITKVSIFSAALAGLMFAASLASADSYVRGYTRSDGSYVQPHYRSSPNSSYNDNWTTRGNTNPYTGQAGTKTPRYESAPAYRTPSYNSGSSSTRSYGSGSNYRR